MRDTRGRDLWISPAPCINERIPSALIKFLALGRIGRVDLHDSPREQGVIICHRESKVGALTRLGVAPALRWPPGIRGFLKTAPSENVRGAANVASFSLCE